MEAAQPPQLNDLSAIKRQLLQERLSGRLPPPERDIIKRRLAGTRVPISTEQHRIWLHASRSPDLPLYNESITIHRRGSFDRDIFDRAFQELLRRHEAWRTSFDIVHEQLIQIVHPPLRLSLPFVDLRSLPEPEREAEALRLAAADAALPIPLEGPLLFRARVICLADDDHRLHLTLHHIIFDGVSIYRILMPELTSIYGTLVEGRPVDLPEPDLQYGDYALWRQQQASSPTVAQHLEYWKTQLSGDLPVLALPLDHPRPPQISHRGSMECFQLSADLISSLRILSRSHGVTLYMTLLAAFKTLMFRYSGQTDLIVGGVTDARRRPELEPLMGYFLDTFAMRTSPAADKPFTAYLREVRTSVLGALAAADVPFDQVVHSVQPRRDQSYHPIFQVFFSIEPPVDPFPEGWDLTQMDVTVRSAKFDLYLELDERPDHMAARFMYNADIFEPSTIRRMADHWSVLLHSICVDPACSLGSLAFLTSPEIAQRTASGGWNDTARPFPSGALHQLIEAQALKTPDTIAAVFADTPWTYSQLIARSTVIASDLRAAGARRGCIVAVLLPRSLDLLAALIAVLQTGAAYLPMDPDTPAARIAVCLDDASPVTILTVTSLRGALPITRFPILLLDPDRSEVPSLQQVPLEEPGPDDIAYVIHTSGSTGHPKAVEISHASVINLLTSMQHEPGFSSSDTLLAVTTVSFDIAALELFLPLVAGGRVVIASRLTAQDPYLLAETIPRSACTVMQATPSTWRGLLASGWRASPEDRTPLRVLCGGEPMPRELADKLLAAGVDLWNVYGPTETTIWSTVHHVGHGEGPVSIGKPIANTTAYILDAGRRLLPAGVRGDLYLGGSGVARGYRGLPTLTAERFVEVASLGGARLYATGDLGVQHEDGTLECLGRTDNQVKVRGFRVELEAVEAAVLRHPNVQAAAARVWPDAAGGARLSVYVVGGKNQPPDLPTLRLFLQTDLPEYMIPSTVVTLDRLPLTSNGKLNRAALPEVSTDATAEIAGEPSSETERRMAALWGKLLQVESIGVHDDFFNLGGHSLLVAALQQRIVTEFDCRLSMASLFHAPTVHQQAALLEAASRVASPPSSLLPLQPRGSRPALFWLHPPTEIKNLADALGDDQPFFGVALTQGDRTAIQEQPDIRKIASQHVDAILRAQPEGPYFLAGFCTGGIVAFETAAQLRARNRHVALLILLDAQNPVFYKRIDSLAVELSKTRFYLRQKYNGVPSQKTFRKRVFFRLRKIWNFESASTEMDASERLTNAAAYRYQPPAYDGDVLLIRPANRPTRTDHLPGWEATVSGRMIARDVPGHHEELFEPGKVRGLAREIAANLLDADRRRI